jgi:hypothetical protein
VLQQSSKPTGENWSFNPEGVHLIHISVSFHPRRLSGECTLHWPCLIYLGPSAAATPQRASPELLGSQEPPALSQKAPLLVMLLVVRQAMTPGVVACFEVPASQQAVGQCSCVWYGECESSII